MAITTDTTYDVRFNDVTVDTIGQSKTLNLYTTDEITAFIYCGCYNNTIQGNLYPFSTTEGSYDTWNANGNKYMPFKSDAVTGTYMELLGGGGSYDDNTPNGRYVGVVWLVDTTGEGFSNNITQQNANKYRIVTEFDARNYYINHGGNFSQVDNYGATSWTDENAGLYNYDYTNESLHYIYKNNNAENDINLYGEISIFPYTAFIDSNTGLLYLIKMSSLIMGTSFRSHIGPNENAGYCLLNFTGNNSASNSLSITYNCVDFSDSFNTTGQNTYNWPYSSTHEVNKYHKTDKNFVGKTHFSVYNFVVSYWFTTLYDLMWLFAAGGLKFKCNDVMYKPLISDNVVYGFTDDLTAESEIDNYTGSTNHPIPVTPPTPPTPPVESKDNEIDVDMSQFAPSVGFVNYIEMDYETAQKVASAFNTYNQSIWNIGGDLFKNLISYKIFAVYGTHSGTIKNIHIAGHELEYNDAPINGNYIDDLGVVDLGSIDVGSKFRFNDWRDFAPYTKIECFVPCCGWCQLPPWVMGRTVTGTMYIDIANGSCKAVIKAGKTPVAEIGGCVAVDVPFSSVATGAKAAGLITAITNGAVSAFNPTPQNLISGSFGILSALNANYTETKGVMGDGSNINGCTQFLIKVTRPASTDTTNGTITNAYKHTKGIPTNKTITLTKGDGFTQITDANITGNMTAREKQMIVDGFRHGLIL